MQGGRLLLVCAPSGAGKTSLVRALAARDERVRVCVSHTTRERRPAEVDGKDYHFVSAATFAAMRAAGAFLEHARKFGHAYGTSRAAVEQARREGCDVVLEIDWQGAAQVRESAPEATAVFILPPSKAALRARLNARAQDEPEVIAERMRQAEDEIARCEGFDYLIVNEKFSVALGQLAQVLQAARSGTPASLPDARPLLRRLL